MELGIVSMMSSWMMALHAEQVAKVLAVYMVFPLLAVAVLFLVRQKLPLWKGIGVVVSVAVAKIIQLVWYRPTPFAAGNIQPLLAHAPNSSFPSDHATLAFALAVLFWPEYPKVALFVGIGAVLISIARISLLLHYPTDILGALAIALFPLAWRRYGKT